MVDYLGEHVIAIPSSYHNEFRRNPSDSLLQYGSLPQRARMPFITSVADIDAALVLPDVVTGRGAEALNLTEVGEDRSRTLIAASHPRSLIDGLAETFRAPDDGTVWHVSVDLALNARRHGDRAGLALGRIGSSWVEREETPLGLHVDRVMRRFDIPLVCQIAAPVGEIIYIDTIVRFILQLKEERGFNITSYSSDQFQSATMATQLMLAGLVTKGVTISPDTGEPTGAPTPFSVSGRASLPYNEVLQALHERRVSLPAYRILRKELRELEMLAPGLAPDHPASGSKDCADAVAGVIGYLAVHGHQQVAPAGAVMDRHDMEDAGWITPAEPAFGPGGDDFGGFGPE